MTETAENDLNAISDYLIFQLSAGENALRQISRIEQAITSLDEMPERYHIYDKEPWNKNNLRVMRVDNYLVFYITDNITHTVTIIRIMYGKRDIDKQL